MRLRKMEARAGQLKHKGGFDPALTLLNPPYTGEEMANVQAECQKMLDRLNA